jgi:toxin CptA
MDAGLQSHYTLHASRSLFWFLQLSCLLVLFVLSQLAWAIAWLLAGAMLVVVACLFVTLRDAKLKLAHSCVSFRLGSENGITLMLRNGQSVTGTISPGSLVTPFLVLLNIKNSEHGRRNLVLMPDCMKRDDYRRLRVVLRWNQ